MFYTSAKGQLTTFSPPPSQGWAALPAASHHAFGDEEYRAAACQPSDPPFNYPQRTGMCDQHQLGQHHPAARQPQ